MKYTQWCNKLHFITTLKYTWQTVKLNVYYTYNNIRLVYNLMKTYTNSTENKTEINRIPILVTFVTLLGTIINYCQINKKYDIGRNESFGLPVEVVGRIF